MFVYSGRLGACDYGPNETITVVFPAKFRLHDPVSAYWQWSKDPKLNKKASVANSGHINSVTTTTDGDCVIHFSFGLYTFQATIPHEPNQITLTMEYPAGSRVCDNDLILSAMHENHAVVRSAAVYTGSLDWPPYAEAEMVTIVVPYGVVNHAFFGLYGRWIPDPSKSRANMNMTINGTFQNVVVSRDGHITATYKDATYSYKFTFNDNEASLVLTNHRKGDVSEDVSLNSVATY